MLILASRVCNQGVRRRQPPVASRISSAVQIYRPNSMRLHGIRTGYPRITGLYTSSHLQNIRETIQINGVSGSETQFATNFFEVWSKLLDTLTTSLDSPDIFSS